MPDGRARSEDLPILRRAAGPLRGRHQFGFRWVERVHHSSAGEFVPPSVPDGARPTVGSRADATAHPASRHQKTRSRRSSLRPSPSEAQGLGKTFDPRHCRTASRRARQGRASVKRRDRPGRARGVRSTAARRDVAALVRWTRNSGMWNTPRLAPCRKR